MLPGRLWSRFIDYQTLLAPELPSVPFTCLLTSLDGTTWDGALSCAQLTQCSSHLLSQVDFDPHNNAVKQQR